MRRIRVSRTLVAGAAGAAAAVLLLTLLGVAPGAAKAETVPEGGDVVMVRCAIGGEFPVVGYQGSPAAPSRRTGSCPASLALLAKDGFRILETARFDQDGDFLVFVLAR